MILSHNENCSSFGSDGERTGLIDFRSSVKETDMFNDRGQDAPRLTNAAISII
jgi:hypothetical protein